MDQVQIQQIENYVEKRTGNLSPVHGFEHLKRTAEGAAWFAKSFGESEENQQTAYLAGLIHDLERPNTEKIDHAQISVREAKQVLQNFKVSDIDKKKVLQQISEHREFESATLDTQWVFLSDKILEQSGAYVVFRRFYFIGECEDYKDMDFFASSMEQWNYRMKKFSPEKYAKPVRKLAAKQFVWQTEFMDDFVKKSTWAVELGKTFFDHGRLAHKNLKQLIQNFASKYPQSRKFQQEALAYMNKERYQEFEKLLDL